MAKIGYRRVSTTDQSLENQSLEDCTKVFEDKLSGKSTKRPGLEALLGYVREGDEVIVHSIDRLARSTRDLLEIVEAITERGASVQFQRENLRFGKGSEDATANLMLHVLAAIGQFERSLMLQRQRVGIERAKAEGKYSGRTRTVDWNEVREAVANGMSKSEASRHFGISRVQVYRILESQTEK